MNTSDIGSIVQFHRRRAGLTQKQLATLADVGKTAVFDIERGKQTVRFSTLTTVLSALNISLDMESPLMNEWRKQVKGE